MSRVGGGRCRDLWSVGGRTTLEGGVAGGVSVGGEADIELYAAAHKAFCFREGIDWRGKSYIGWGTSRIPDRMQGLIHLKRPQTAGEQQYIPVEQLTG